MGDKIVGGRGPSIESEDCNARPCSGEKNPMLCQLTVCFYQKRQNSDDYQVIINEQPITCVSTTMFLGVLLDHNLTWKPHLSLFFFSRKMSKSIGLIYKSSFTCLETPCACCIIH